MREKFSRTSVIAIVLLVANFGTMIGIQFDVAGIEEAVGQIYDGFVKLQALILPVVMLYLRTITDSPMLKGLRGLLFKRG